MTIQRTCFSRLDIAFPRCTDLAFAKQALQFQGPSLILECCQIVRVSLPSPRWQCSSSCLLHPRSRTQFSEAQIKFTVSIKSSLPFPGWLTVETRTPSNVWSCSLVPQNTSGHISSMLIYFPMFSACDTRSSDESLQKTAQAGSQPFYSGPIVLSSRRKVRMCLPMSCGFRFQVLVNRCTKIHGQTASKCIVTFDTQSYPLE